MVMATRSRVFDRQLPREYLLRALNRRLEREASKTAVILFEIDQFRRLEQNFSGAEVARILLTLEMRIKESIRTNKSFCRLGGGRFAIIPAPIQTATPEKLGVIAADLQTTTFKPIPLKSGQAHISLSVGYATQDSVPASSGAALLDAAAIALLEASASGLATIRAYSPAMHDRASSRKELAIEVGPAIQSGAIHAFFQPQVDIKSNRIVGFEALARWYHAERGMIPPAEFLPVLAQLGMMRELGFTILRAALSALHEWDRAGFEVPTISINMSAEELGNPNLVDAICLELDRFDMTPDRLVIEVLETVVAADKDDMVLSNIKALSRLGCSIDLDDFGTGQASITSIRQFGVDRIKIDSSFVRYIDTDKDQQDMVLAMLTMSERLRVNVIAEGVETPAELAFISKTACQLVQGYAIARPMPGAEVAGWINGQVFHSSFARNQQYIQ